MKTGPTARWFLSLPVHVTGWAAPTAIRAETVVTVGRHANVDVSSTWTRYEIPSCSSRPCSVTRARRRERKSPNSASGSPSNRV